MHRRQFLGAAAATAALANQPVHAADAPAAPGIAIPARTIPVPETVSPQLRNAIAGPFPPNILGMPKTPQEWAMLQGGFPGMLEGATALRKALNVSLDSYPVAGVPCLDVAPAAISRLNKRRIIIHLHGGAYAMGGGEAGSAEAVALAAATGINVLSVDFRLPPDHPYPAGLDDAQKVWAWITNSQPQGIAALCGTSSGAAMVLSLTQRLIAGGHKLPGALVCGTPWSDLSKTGDSYFANDTLDGVVRQYEGSLEHFAKAYAGGIDLKDPRVSPVYGRFEGFPPSLLITGTRDLFLSNTVRVHRRMRQAGVEALLDVYEGVSHGQYSMVQNAPETAESLGVIAAFLDKHLGY